MWACPTKPLDQKMFWQNAALAFGVSIALRPAPWIGASLVAAQQSAPGWTCSNAHRLRRRDVRRQGIGNVWDAGGAVGGGNAAGIDPNLGKS
jgi:hypothetical protein